jgi:hypothetical protein
VLESQRLDSRYSVLGTLRADGSPRISGIVAGVSVGELLLTMKPRSAMAEDLRRDPRRSLHSGPSLRDVPPNDVKLNGRAVEISDASAIEWFTQVLPHEPTSADIALFTLDITDAASIRLSEDRRRHLIDSWRAGEEGTRHRER